jgi:hypothetical protein
LALRFSSDESTRTESRAVIESRGAALGAALGALPGAALGALTGSFDELCCTTAGVMPAPVALAAGTGAAVARGPRAQPATVMMTAIVVILFTFPDLLKTKSPPKAAISVLEQPLLRTNGYRVVM